MTEGQWLAATDPTPFLLLLSDAVSGRKLRLFAVACCHQLRGHATIGDGLRAVELAELFADGMASRAALRRAKGSMRPDGRAAAEWAARWSADSSALSAALNASIFANEVVGRPDGLRWQLIVFRCIFGNPFRPVAVDPSWLTSTVVALAEGIYAERAFDRLPILADALQDAGCDHADILSHCRGDGPHVRGCWVVDLILGKS